MSSANRSLQEEDAKIDLTPMLDVVFIMLIFFIVTASFVREFGIDLETPPPGKPVAQDENPNVLVRLQADNQIFIDGLRIDHRSLRAYFERHKASHPEAALVISADKQAKTAAVVRISNAARQASIRQVILQSVDRRVL